MDSEHSLHAYELQEILQSLIRKEFTIENVQAMIAEYEKGGSSEIFLEDYLTVMAVLYENYADEWKDPETVHIAWDKI